MKTAEIISKIEARLSDFSDTGKVAHIGVVARVGDGIVTATGLSRVAYNEEVEFEDGSLGFVLGLDEDYVQIVLLTPDAKVDAGQSVKSTGRILSIRVSDDLLGRVVDPLGNALDGKKLSAKGEVLPLEQIAPGVIERAPIDTPMKTGILSLDALTPIGRGQRQLIIGDRGTGKTAIAVDTILNQKKRDLDLSQVICIYCAIGQKRANVARTVARLSEEGALDYTVVVAATASDPASYQYLAPYAACTIGEYFMRQGKDVLVIYDDLSKHAWAYRQISLILRRPAGREAYPGDIFYLHSRLLERAARMSEKNGGGSLTAFPVIETQAGDLSAYIPTNVISITDGQIFLDTDLFNQGVRPAISVGLSVSRVGGAAQTKAIKQFAGPLRLEQAQYRELAAFAQFGSDLDEVTQKQIARGKRITEILKQPQYAPASEAAQIIILYAATSGALDSLPVEIVPDFTAGVYEFIMGKNKKLISALSSGQKLEEKTLKDLAHEIEGYKKTLK